MRSAGVSSRYRGQNTGLPYESRSLAILQSNHTSMGGINRLRCREPPQFQIHRVNCGTFQGAFHTYLCYCLYYRYGVDRSRMPTEKTIKSFWNRAADQSPHWYVSSYGSYDAQRDLGEFWASGRTIWTDIKRVTGYTPASADRVVEIGCGIGRLTRVIAPEVGQVIALDISEKMLAIARQANLPNVEFRTAQGFVLSGIPDSSVNFSLSYCVFQHLPSHTALKSYLAEMHRVTKAGGMIAFTLTPRNWRTWLLPALRELICGNTSRAEALKVFIERSGSASGRALPPYPT